MKQYLMIASLCIGNIIFANTPTPTTLHYHQPLSSFSAIDMPIAEVHDPFTTGIFTAIDTTFGKKGIDLNEQQITHLKKTYLYLIFLTKLEIVTINPAFAQYKTAFMPYLQDNKNSLPHIPSQNLVTSSDWNNVTITAQDLAHSTAWQLYIRSMIADIYVYFSIVLQVIHNVEKQTFNYIPHFETSFYNADYTDFRNLNEMARTRLILEENLKQRWLQQCPDWQNLPTINPKESTKNQNSIELAIVQFRKTQFYQTIHNIHTTLGISPNTISSSSMITNEQLLSAPRLSSPLKEHVWCYYMLYEASGQITSSLTTENLLQFLQVFENTTLPVDIFPYTINDYVVLDELITIKSKAEGNTANSMFPSAQQYKIEDIRKPEHVQQTYRNYQREVEQKLATAKTMQVQAQMWSFFKDIGHDLSEAFDDVKNAIEDGWDAVKDFAIAAGQGIAGLAAKTVGFFAELGGDDAISDWADSEMKNAHKTFVKASTDLSNCVTDFGKSIEDGWVAPYAELTGDLVGFITDDKKIGQDISTVINKVDDTIINVAAQTENVMLQQEAGGLQSTYNIAKVSTQLAIVVSDAAWAIFSSKGRTEFLQQGEQLGKDCLSSITQAYSSLMTADKAMLTAVITGLGAIVNSITTIFIDISREVTYLFTGGIFKVLGLANIPGFKQAAAYAAQTRDHVTNVLQAHRATINMVTGVVACIATDAVFDVATDGAGTTDDVAIDEAIIGASESAAQTSTQVAQDAAQTASELEDAANVAKQTLESANKTLQDLPADATEEQVQAAQQLVDDASEKAAQAEEQATQASLKASRLAKTAAETTGKNTEQTAELTSKNFAQKIAQKAQSKIESSIENIKSLPESLSKSASNLLKSNQDLAQEASDYASSMRATQETAQEAFDSAQTTLKENQELYAKALQEGDQDAIENSKNALDESSQNVEQTGKALKEANQNLKEAETAEDAAAKIANETKLGKAARYGKNVLKTLGKVLKPVGEIMNVTFNLGSIIADYNQDEKNSLQEKTQTKTLDALWRFENENKLAQAEQQLAFLEEITAKTQAMVGNQALGLTLSQNNTNANIMQLRESFAQTLAPLYAQLLMPNSITGLRLANIGTSWKLQTNYMDLYPSQGFFTTTTGRPDFPFAQEIAQAPEITKQFTAKGTSKLWFNQRCTARDNFTTDGKQKKAKDPLTVEVNFRFLYTLNSQFHVGLYLGGNYHDYTSSNFLDSNLQGITLAQAQANPALLTKNTVNANIIDLDETFLAKMIVLYRDSATSKLTLGVYEDEGLGWIIKEPLPEIAQLNASHTYRLQATLNNTDLTFALYLDTIMTPVFEKTVKVTQLKNQRTYGIICSGAAIEWNQLQPNPIINSSARSQTTPMQTEVQREQQNKLKLAQAANPKFGNFKLTPLSKQALLLGQYLYATTDTDMKKILNDQKDMNVDFVIFGTQNPGSSPFFGLDPQTALSSSNPILISVINGSIYDMQGNCIGSADNVWSEYSKQYGPFSPMLNNFISKQQTLIVEKLETILFGAFKLNIIDYNTKQPGSSSALLASQYIYTCNQTLTNAQGEPIVDYLVCADTITSTIQIGLPPTADNATALFSFVTGNLYAKNTILSGKSTPKPVSTNPNPSALLGSYASEYNLPSSGSIFITINNAYVNYVPPTNSTTTTQTIKTTPKITVQPVHFKKGVHLLLRGQTIGNSKNAPGVHLDFSKSSFQERQKSASGKNIGYQLYNITESKTANINKKS